MTTISQLIERLSDYHKRFGDIPIYAEPIAFHGQRVTAPARVWIGVDKQFCVIAGYTENTEKTEVTNGVG